MLKQILGRKIVRSNTNPLWETIRQLRDELTKKDELIARLKYALVDEVQNIEHYGGEASEFTRSLLDELE